MVGQAHPPEYHALSLNHHMKVKEGWSRVPARDAIGLLVRLSTARNRGQSAVVFMAASTRCDRAGGQQPASVPGWRIRLREKDGPVFTNPRLGPAITFLKDIHSICSV